MAGSPQLEFYATKLGEPSRPQDTNRFFNSVTVHRGSSITLTCTATEPLGFPSRLEPYLRPYVINWFVNSSTIQVSNCDEKPRKTKTCLLSLVNVKPRDNDKYFCQAANELGCTYKQLHLKVTDGEKLFTSTWQNRDDTSQNACKFWDLMSLLSVRFLWLFYKFFQPPLKFMQY